MSLALALALALPTASASAGPGVIVAVDEASVVRRALERAAVADVVDGDIDAARATAVELRTWQNPELAYTREQTYGSGGTGEDYLSVGQLIDLGGRRRLRGKAAMIRSEAVAERGAAFRVLLAAEVRLRYYEVLYRHRRAEALAAWSSRLVTALSTIATRERAGDVARYDRRRLERELALAQAREEVEAAALARSWARLAALADLDAGAPQALSGVLLPEGRPDAADRYVDAAATRPELRALERAGAAAAIDEQAARRARVPGVTFGLGWKGVKYPGGLRSDGFVVNAALTLPVLDRGQGPARRAEAEGRALRGRLALARHELAGEIVGLRAEADRLHVLAGRFADERRRDGEASTAPPRHL